MGLFSKLKKLDPGKKLLKKAVKADPLGKKLVARDVIGKKVLGLGAGKKSKPVAKPMTTGGNTPAQVAQPASPTIKPGLRATVGKFGDLGSKMSNRNRARY